MNKVNQNNSIIPVGHIADFEGRPVLKSCMNCAHREDVSDGYEYGGPYYACTKEGKEHMSNLKSWPFKTPQKCFILHNMHAIDWSAVAAKEEQEMLGASASSARKAMAGNGLV